MGGWGSRWPRPPLPAPLIFAVTSMQSPVWSPVSFCHPSHFLEALDPHWGPEFSDITPKALAQPRSCPPHRQMPSQDSLGHHLPLPVPVGAATSGVPEFLFILGPFLHGEGAQEQFSRRETEDRKPGRGRSRWPWPIRPYMGSCFWGPAPATTLSRALMVACRRDRPRNLCLLSQICAPELDEATVAALAEPLRHLRFGTRADQDKPCPVDFLHLLKLPQEG